MVDFFAAQSLKPHHFIASGTDWLIDGFLAKGAITMIYAPSGAGKSYLALAIVKNLIYHLRYAIYIDRESRIGDLKRRGVLELIENYPNLCYMHRATMEQSANETLKIMESLAVKEYYKNSLIILDGAKHFLADIESDKQTREMMNMIISLRDAGATIFITHHTTKSGANYQGSKELIESSDNVFSAAKIDNVNGAALLLTPAKMRDAIVDKAYSVATDGSLDMTELDENAIAINENESALIESVVAAIESGAKKQSEILEALGRAKSDKELPLFLDRFAGTVWNIERGEKNVKIYQLCNSTLD